MYRRNNSAGLKSCLRGLRYPVESVLEWLASVIGIEEILGDYQDLEREDVLAALAYAARLVHTNPGKNTSVPLILSLDERSVNQPGVRHEC